MPKLGLQQVLHDLEHGQPLRRALKEHLMAVAVKEVVRQGDEHSCQTNMLQDHEAMLHDASDILGYKLDTNGLRKELASRGHAHLARAVVHENAARRGIAHQWKGLGKAVNAALQEPKKAEVCKPTASTLPSQSRCWSETGTTFGAQALAACSSNGLALEFAADALKADMDVALAAVKNNGLALRYAAASMKADKDVVMAAVGMAMPPQTKGHRKANPDPDTVEEVARQHVPAQTDQPLYAAVEDEGARTEHAAGSRQLRRHSSEPEKEPGAAAHGGSVDQQRRGDTNEDGDMMRSDDDKGVACTDHAGVASNCQGTHADTRPAQGRSIGCQVHFAQRRSLGMQTAEAPVHSTQTVHADTQTAAQQPMVDPQQAMAWGRYLIVKQMALLEKKPQMPTPVVLAELGDAVEEFGKSFGIGG